MITRTEYFWFSIKEAEKAGIVNTLHIDGRVIPFNYWGGLCWGSCKLVFKTSKLTFTDLRERITEDDPHWRVYLELDKKNGYFYD